MGAGTAVQSPFRQRPGVSLTQQCLTQDPLRWEHVQETLWVARLTGLVVARGGYTDA